MFTYYFKEVYAMQKQRKESMEEQLGAAPVPKLLLKMAAPMVVAMVVNGLYYLVDAAFVGMAVGASALSGLAAVFPIQMLAVALATMLGVGTSSVVSRKLGESDDDGASFALKNALMFAAVLGVIVSAVLTIFKTSVLSLMGASGEAMVEADAYYTVIVPGIILIFISFLELNAIRAEGNAKLAAFGMFLGSVLNIGFDALFIFVFRLGTAGAAWGTVAARFITTILLLRYYLTGNSIVNIRSGGWKLSWKLIWTVNMLGIGAFLNQIGFAVLSVIMNLLLKQYGTETVMAVFGVLARIFVFVTMPLMGIAQGLQPIVGYNHGAGDQRRVRQGIICAYLYALALGALMVVLIIFMPGGVLGILRTMRQLLQAARTRCRSA